MNFSSIKFSVLLLLLSQWLCLSVIAQVSVNKAPDLTNLCPGGNSGELGTILIKERVAGDFVNSTGGTPAPIYHSIILPANYEFEVGSGSVEYIGTATVVLIAPTLSADKSTFTFSYTMLNTANDVGVFAVRYLKVKAQLAASASGNITGTVASAIYGVVGESGFDTDLFASASTICSPGSVTLQAYPSSSSYRYYYKDASNNWVQPSTAVTSQVWVVPGTYLPNTSFSTAFNQDFRVDITQGGCTQSAYKTIKINPKPDNSYTAGSSIAVYNNESPKPLTIPNPNGYVVTYSGNGVISSSFYPTTFTSVSFPYNTTVNYTFRNSAALGGCTSSNTYAIYNVLQAITNSPAFLHPQTPMPFCEVGGNQFVDITFCNSCIINNITVTPVIGTSPLVGIGNPTGTSYERTLEINPLIHSSSYRINIKVDYRDQDGNAQTESADVSVLPKQSPSAIGIPAYYYSYYISSNPYRIGTPICKKSNDSATIRAYPDNATLEFYKVKSTEATNDLKYISLMGRTDLIRNPNKNAVIDTLKFVPYTIWKNGLSGASDSILIIKVSPPVGSYCAQPSYYHISFTNSTFEGYINYSIQSVPPYCGGDTLLFKIKPQSTQPFNAGWCGPTCRPYETYTWNFGDGTSVINDTSLTIKHYYKVPGSYTVRFTAFHPIPAPQCVIDSIQQLRVGTRPNSDFEVKNFYDAKVVTYKNLSTMKLPRSTDIKDTIITWKWYYGDGNQYTSVLNVNATHLYAGMQVLPYPVSLVTSTPYGCKDSITKHIPIFPVYSPKEGAGYAQTFDGTGPTGWYQSGYYRHANDSSSWKNIVPNGKFINNPKYQKAWITSKVHTARDSAGYFPGEKSWVESPAFDLTKATRPMLSFNSWALSESQLDGTNLQYCIIDTTFGNETWTTLGTSATGSDWYNSNIIISKPLPGNTFDQGWTDSTGKDWSLSSYNLDLVKNLAGNKLVRFRVAFNSNLDNAPGNYDGFAFDNFFVGQRNRKVLVEEFCDYGTKHYEPEFNKIPYSNDPQLVRVQYHTRYMNLDDEINNQNKGEAGARNLLYGYSRLPRAAVDGNYSLDFNNPFFGSAGQTNFDKRVLEVSPFTIKFSTPVVSGNSLQFSVDFTRDTTFNNDGPFVLQVAALEKQVVGNGITFTNVFRKFLPDASGEHVDKDKWPTGGSGTKTLTRSFTPFVDLTTRALPNDTSIILVAFVQDEATNIVHQSEAIYVDYGVVQNLKKIPLTAKLDMSNAGISLYPNPAQNNTVINFNNGKSQEDYEYRLVDGFGITLKSGIIPEGSTDFTLTGLQDFPVGLYQLQLSGNINAFTKSFTIVR